MISTNPWKNKVKDELVMLTYTDCKKKKKKKSSQTMTIQTLVQIIHPYRNLLNSIRMYHIPKYLTEKLCLFKN